jgi:FkbM family methyltransferase
MVLLKKILNNIKQVENFTFVSIGANDGIFVDEVFQSKLLDLSWDSHFVEPIKERFDLLVSNYEDHYPNNNFKYYNYAIHTEEGDDFLITENIDDSKGMCSFFRADTNTTVKIPIKKKPFRLFLEDSKIKKIDFLKIDCEGMDTEIILQCFDENIFPELILFEDINLETNVRKIENLEKYIKDSDYLMINDTPEFQYEESNKLLIKKKYINV